MADITMIPCDSSFISAYGFDQDEQVLKVRFRKDGAEVEYSSVPQLEYDRMRSDPRPGSYFRSHIYKEGYNWSRV